MQSEQNKNASFSFYKIKINLIDKSFGELFKELAEGFRE
jgi:hypothetical protein